MASNSEEFVIVKYEDEGEDETDSAPMEPLTVIKEGQWFGTQSPGPAPLRLKLTDSLMSSVQHSQSTSSLPSTEIWPGNFNIDYQVEDSGNWKKRGFAYSTVLNKLYVDMEKQVALKFFISGKTPSNSVIRAVPVYVDIASRSQPVLRCPVHSSLEDPSNRQTPSPILKHLVRSSETSVQYFENQTSGRLSLTTAVKDQAPGCDYFTIFYQFMCLGSCLGGLARRQLQMIFTLETHEGEVLGRQVMEVRICSCPIRDMKQEEQKFSKHNETTKQSPKRLAPVQMRIIESLPYVQKVSPVSTNMPVLAKAKEPDQQPTNYAKDDDIFWVPVRGVKNYQEVNRFAEYLDLTNGNNYLTDSALSLKKQRNKLIVAANPNHSGLITSGKESIKAVSNNDELSEPEAKRRKSCDQYSQLLGKPVKATSLFPSQTEVLAPAPTSAPRQTTTLQTRFQPIMPKPTRFLNQPSILPRSQQSILLQPKTTLTHFQPTSSYLQNNPLSLSTHLSNSQNIHLRENSRKVLKEEEDSEEEEMIIADSLNINNEDSNDGLSELQNQVSCKTYSDVADSVLSI